MKTLEQKQRECRARHQGNDDAFPDPLATFELDTDDRQKIRKRAAACVLVTRGVPVKEVARRLNCTAEEVIRWDKAARPFLSAFTDLEIPAKDLVSARFTVIAPTQART